MPDPRTHLIVCTPCYGGMVTGVYTASLLGLLNACKKRGNVDLDVKMIWGDALITRARQDLVAHFLEIPTSTHLLFIDADISFDTEQVFRLLDFNEDMAAAVYPTKKIDWEKVKAQVLAGKTPLEPASLSYVLGVEDARKIGYKNGFVKVKFAGTGFLMIKRAALVRMIEHYPDLRYSKVHQAEDALRDSQWRSSLFNCFTDETGTYLSEDFSFCRRWTDIGGEIWMDLQSRLTHVGAMAFHGDFTTQIPPLPPVPPPAKS
jgi:hypothetical protein